MLPFQNKRKKSLQPGLVSERHKQDLNCSSSYLWDSTKAKQYKL